MNGAMPATLADLPIPAGQSAVAEAGLLAQAVVAASPGFAEARFAVQQRASVVPSDARYVHVTLTRRGQPAGSYFIELPGHGFARYRDQVSDEVRATALDLAVDVSDLLTSRLCRLADAVAATGSDHFSTPVRNATEASEAVLAAGGTDPALATLANQLMQACLTGAGSGSADELLALARELAAAADRQHSSWRLIGWSQAAIMLAVNVPMACAAASGSGDEQRMTFARYLGTAASSLRSGDWRAVGQVVGQAISEGNGAALAGLNAALYSEAIRLRDEALAGPTSPMLFGQKLFEAMPMAFAAWWISVCAEDAGAGPASEIAGDTWKKRRTESEEVYTRLADGVFAQWWRWHTDALQAERREVMSVLKTQGKLAANELLRKGEDASYHRPRSLRPYLRGERETPDGS